MDLANTIQGSASPNGLAATWQIARVKSLERKVLNATGRFNVNIEKNLCSNRNPSTLFRTQSAIDSVTVHTKSLSRTLNPAHYI